MMLDLNSEENKYIFPFLVHVSAFSILSPFYTYEMKQLDKSSTKDLWTAIRFISFSAVAQILYFQCLKLEYI